MKTLILVSLFHWKLSTLLSENLYILKTFFLKIAQTCAFWQWRQETLLWVTHVWSL